jgi:hypothetical protein
MTTRSSQTPVQNPLSNVSSADELPSHPEAVPVPTYSSSGIQNRSQTSRLEASFESQDVTQHVSKRARVSSTGRPSMQIAVMNSINSSPVSGSLRSESEQSGEDEWMPSGESDTATTADTTTTANTAMTAITATKATGPNVFRFKDLTKDVQQVMYQHFLSIPPGVDFQLDQSITDWEFGKVSGNILKVSKGIYLDAYPVFLRENKFLIGTSLTNPNILRDFGPTRCKFLRSLSIQLNNRPLADSIQILDELSLYCHEIQHLQLRVSPASPLLPHLASMLVARTQAGSSSTAKIVLRLFVRKLDANAMLLSDHARMVQVAQDIQNSLYTTFRWPQILERADDIVIRGCIYRSSLDVLESFQYQGWHFTRNITTPVANCTTSEEIVVRTWEPIGQVA